MVERAADLTVLVEVDGIEYDLSGGISTLRHVERQRVSKDALLSQNFFWKEFDNPETTVDLVGIIKNQREVFRNNDKSATIRVTSPVPGGSYALKVLQDANRSYVQDGILAMRGRFVGDGDQFASDTRAPVTPLILNTSPFHNRIAVTWDRVDGINYEVSIDNGVYVRIGEVGDYVFRNLEPETSHIIKVRGDNGYEVSQEASITVSTTATPLPSAVTGFSSTSVGHYTIVMGWTAIAGLTYEINFNGGGFFSVEGPDTVSISNLTPTTSYEIGIRAVNEFGHGPATTTQVQTADLPQPVAPANLMSEIEWNYAEFSWDDPGIEGHFWEYSLDDEAWVELEDPELELTFLTEERDYELDIRGGIEDRRSAPVNADFTTPSEPPPQPWPNWVAPALSLTGDWRSPRGHITPDPADAEYAWYYQWRFHSSDSRYTGDWFDTFSRTFGFGGYEEGRSQINVAIEARVVGFAGEFSPSVVRSRRLRDFDERDPGTSPPGDDDTGVDRPGDGDRTATPSLTVQRVAPSLVVILADTDTNSSRYSWGATITQVDQFGGTTTQTFDETSSNRFLDVTVGLGLAPAIIRVSVRVRADGYTVSRSAHRSIAISY